MQEQPLSVFSAAYWRAARAEFRNVRTLALAGLVCAMAIVLEAMPIYLLGPSLKIYFSYLVVSLGCMCYGPLVGMVTGVVIDTMGFLLAGYGEPYFPGYLVTAMLSGLIYGVMYYRRRPTVGRIIITRLLINYGSNVLLGSVWGADADIEDASLDSYIRFIRRRLAAVGSRAVIRTVRGAGYRLEPGGAPEQEDAHA